jgi:hypothetical protein
MKQHLRKATPDDGPTVERTAEKGLRTFILEVDHWARGDKRATLGQNGIQLRRPTLSPFQSGLDMRLENMERSSLGIRPGHPDTTPTHGQSCAPVLRI